MTDTRKKHITFSHRAEVVAGCSDSARGQASAILIGMHGYGESGSAMLEFTQRIAGDNFAYACPNAPQQFYHQLDGWKDTRVGHCWITRDDRDGALNSCHEYIEGVVDWMHEEFGASREHVIMIGFSQAVSICYTLGFRMSDKVKAIVAIGGARPKYNDDLFNNCESKPSLYISHGMQDKIVPVSRAQEDEVYFKGLGMNVKMKTYDVGHIRSVQQGDDIANWLRETAL